MPARRGPLTGQLTTPCRAKAWTIRVPGCETEPKVRHSLLCDIYRLPNQIGNIQHLALDHLGTSLAPENWYGNLNRLFTRLTPVFGASRKGSPNGTVPEKEGTPPAGRRGPFLTCS